MGTKSTNIWKKILKHLKAEWWKYGLETLVVVIGILIAFALNNWNENRKAEKLEIQFLVKLRRDLAKDTLYYHSLIKKYTQSIEQFKIFIPKSYEVQKNKEEFVELLAPLGWHSDAFTPENSTFEELTSTGQTGLFRNDSIKDAIVSLYKEQERIGKHIDQLNSLSRVDFYKFAPNILKYIVQKEMFDQPYMFHEQEWDFINKPDSEQFRLVEGSVSTYSFKHGIFKDYFETILIRTKNLIELINKELDDRGV